MIPAVYRQHSLMFDFTQIRASSLLNRNNLTFVYVVKWTLLVTFFSLCWLSLLSKYFVIEDLIFIFCNKNTTNTHFFSLFLFLNYTTFSFNLNFLRLWSSFNFGYDYQLSWLLRLLYQFWLRIACRQTSLWSNIGFSNKFEFTMLMFNCGSNDVTHVAKKSRYWSLKQKLMFTNNFFSSFPWQFRFQLSSSGGFLICKSTPPNISIINFNFFQLLVTQVLFLFLNCFDSITSPSQRIEYFFYKNRSLIS